MSKRKILIISAVFCPEPVVSAIVSKAIAEKASEFYDVTVVSPRPTRPFGYDFPKESEDTLYKHITLDSYTCPQSSILGRFRESYSFGKYCSDFILKNKFDLVYQNSWPIFAQFQISKACCEKNIPLITHVQDVYPESLSSKFKRFSFIIDGLLKPLDVKILNSSEKIIAISEKMKNYLSESRGIDSSKIEVMLNWQDHEPFLQTKETKRGNDKFTFMYLGNIGPVAGIELLIESFVKASLSEARLIIAGSGSMKESLRTYSKSFMNADIQFWDVPGGEVPSVQAQADVLLLPIKKGAASSSIPSKLPAYMFSKKPVLVSADLDSDSVNVILKSHAGIAVEPENIGLLAEKMTEFYSMNEVELSKLGKNGREYALEHFTRDSNLKVVLDIFNQISYGQLS